MADRIRCQRARRPPSRALGSRGRSRLCFPLPRTELRAASSTAEPHPFWGNWLAAAPAVYCAERAFRGSPVAHWGFRGRRDSVAPKGVGRARRSGERRAEWRRARREFRCLDVDSHVTSTGVFELFELRYGEMAPDLATDERYDIAMGTARRSASALHCATSSSRARGRHARPVPSRPRSPTESLAWPPLSRYAAEVRVRATVRARAAIRRRRCRAGVTESENGTALQRWSAGAVGRSGSGFPVSKEPRELCTRTTTSELASPRGAHSALTSVSFDGRGSSAGVRSDARRRRRPPHLSCPRGRKTSGATALSSNLAPLATFPEAARALGLRVTPHFSVALLLGAVGFEPTTISL